MAPNTPPPWIHFGRAVCGDAALAQGREWWLANGLGAYAGGTIAGSLTRRYHGLLIAPIRPPLGRSLVVAKADAHLQAGDRRWPLFTNQWGDGVVAPQGYLHLESFHLDGALPVWRFAAAELRLEMRVWLEPGALTSYVAYRLEPGPGALPPCHLQLTLLINQRDHHSASAAGSFTPKLQGHGAEWYVEAGDYTLGVMPHGLRELTPVADWYRDFHLPQEQQRGLDASDNHLAVAQISLDLQPGVWSGLSLHLNPGEPPMPAAKLAAALQRVRQRQDQILSDARTRVPCWRHAPAWLQQLLLAADSFVIQRRMPGAKTGVSVIAGYPWFGDWGRDTMIALPGLTLATGRTDYARDILATFAQFIDRGMLPNRFPGTGARADYNTVDAALWFIEAWRAYDETVADDAFLHRHFAALEQIIEWYWRGTRFGIGVDPADGLLQAGADGVQLTWMDAKVGAWVVTPRHGKAVEINALWYNALHIMAAGAARVPARARRYDPAHYLSLAEQARQGLQRFVKPGGGLYDVLDGPNGHDPAIRPNQIFAVSLPHSALSTAQQADVVAQCARHLLCSYGLRSLAPTDANYRPYYGGGVSERDGAYHQGTVWAWLLGPYALAEFRVTGDTAAAQQRLAPMAEHLLDAGLGTISEIFDGAEPHAPKGAPSQAWSVACILEAWWRLAGARSVQPKGDRDG